MRIKSSFALRRFEKDGTATMESLSDALNRVLDLAEPVEAIEVSLSEAVGLVLAEPAIADVDLPPFDRATSSGFAVAASETVQGGLLRVAVPWTDADGHDIEPGEAARVEPGDAMPVGSDAVLSLDSIRPDPPESEGLPRVIEVLQAIEPGRSVVRRGATLGSGSILADAGTRLRPSMVGLLAAQGCVHPICHRRVRVSIFAVGEHLVGPADPPVLHHERNAANLAVSVLLLDREAMIHDLGSVPEARFASTLDRALNAPVVIVLGRLNGEMRRAFARAGVEPTVSGLAIEPGGGNIGHGIVRDDDGRVVSHVIHLPIDPIAAVVATALFVQPLIARLQGEEAPAPPIRAVWDARSSQPATGERLRAIPSRLILGSDARLRARPVVDGGSADLPDFADADGLALLPPYSGPWRGGEVVDFIPFRDWSGRSDE